MTPTQNIYLNLDRDLPKVVLITGAGSGIGLALTRLLWDRPEIKVVATARPLALKELASTGLRDNDRFLLRPLDVTSSNSRRVLIKEINSIWGGVDTLINNAGISFRSTLEDMDTSEEELQMATNYFGPLGLIREVLPSMRQKRSGQIINVSSVGGMMAMPTMGSYSASKFALEGATEALWYELKPWGISVSLIQPGFINSTSFTRIYRSAKSRSISDYSLYYKNMEIFVEKLMQKASATPESVAIKIATIVEAGKAPLRVPATADAHFFSLLRRILPRQLYHQILFRNLPNIKNWLQDEEIPKVSTVKEIEEVGDAGNF